tara:strand:- start:407 stop:1201 length:795 start_codon:yes stop_codon:yes gene_type:complete
MDELTHFISLGAGVQSSTMSIMAARGEITPMPKAAIFSDTGAEKQSTYDWLDELEKELPFPVHRVIKAEGLLADVEKNMGKGVFDSSPPFYMTKVKRAIQRRCTRQYKVRPVDKKIKELMGLARVWKPKTPVVSVWVGISLDEIQRMRDSDEPWMEHRYPLVDMRMTRGDCLEWMNKNGYPSPPRSACWFCPYLSNSSWRNMRDNDPDDFKKVKALSKRLAKHDYYLHPDKKPMDEVDLSTDVDKGQGVLFGDFIEECDGMCGT